MTGDMAEDLHLGAEALCIGCKRRGLFGRHREEEAADGLLLDMIDAAMDQTVAAGEFPREFLEQGAGGGRAGDIDADGYGTIGDERLYQLLRQDGPVKARDFSIEFLDPGARAYAFTFG